MEEEKLQESITIENILLLFKKGWKIILAYVIFFVIAATLIMSIVGLVAAQKSYETDITFNNDNIMKGMSPWDSTFDINSIAKSSSVVTVAMTECGYNDEDIEDMIDNIISNISVIADKAIENANGEKYAYSYKLNLKKDKDVPLSNAQYLVLTENLAKQVISAIKSEYSYAISYAAPIAIDYEKTNFVKAYDILKVSLKNLKTTTNEFASYAPNFRSTRTGKTFTNLNAEIEIIEIELASLQFYLAETPTSNSQNTGAAEKEYIKQKASGLATSTANLQTRIAALAEIIKEIKPDIIINSTSEIKVTTTNEEFYEQVSLYNSLQAEYQSQIEEKAIWDNLSTSYDGVISSDETSNAFVKTLSSKIQSELLSIYDDAVEMVDDYNQNDLLKNAIKITSPATRINESAIGTILFIILEVLVVFIAIVIGLIVTNNRISKKGKKEVLTSES